jgi:hypothetical protein
MGERLRLWDPPFGPMYREAREQIIADDERMLRVRPSGVAWRRRLRAAVRSAINTYAPRPRRRRGRLQRL